MTLYTNWTGAWPTAAPCVVVTGNWYAERDKGNALPWPDAPEGALVVCNDEMKIENLVSSYKDVRSDAAEHYLFRLDELKTQYPSCTIGLYATPHRDPSRNDRLAMLIDECYTICPPVYHSGIGSVGVAAEWASLRSRCSSWPTYRVVPFFTPMRYHTVMVNGQPQVVNWRLARNDEWETECGAAAASAVANFGGAVLWTAWPSWTASSPQVIYQRLQDQTGLAYSPETHAPHPLLSAWVQAQAAHYAGVALGQWALHTGMFAPSLEGGGNGTA